MKTNRKVNDSKTVFTEMVLPNHANPLGYLRGGKLIDWMDIAAEMTVQKHAHKVGVTASVNSLTFEKPIKVGDIVTIQAQITRVFGSSLEVWVQAWSENYIQETTSKKYIAKSKTNEAFFTFVIINKEGKAVDAPKIIPETKQEKELYESAMHRRKNRSV